MIRNRLLPEDSCVNGVIGINSYHARQHAGKAFEASICATTVATTGITYYIRAGSTNKCHLDYTIITNADIYAELREGITIATAGIGSQITAYNNNRNSSNTASTLIYNSGTISASGTLIEKQFSPSGGARKITGAGEAGDGREWILASDTDYMLRVKAFATSARCLINLNFYEC